MAYIILGTISVIILVIWFMIPPEYDPAMCIRWKELNDTDSE